VQKAHRSAAQPRHVDCNGPLNRQEPSSSHCLPSYRVAIIAIIAIMIALRHIEWFHLCKVLDLSTEKDKDSCIALSQEYTPPLALHSNAGYGPWMI
jgi:hypothetical protein